MRRAFLLAVGLLVLGGFAAAESLTISGKVLETDGRPVPGAWVSTTYWQEGGWLVTGVTSDEEGAFKLQITCPSQPGPPGVLVHKPGFAMAEADFTGKPLVFTLSSKPETRSGVVLDAQGKPLAGAQVVADRLYYHVPENAPHDPNAGHDVTFWLNYGDPEFLAVTDALGRFSFRDFPHDWRLVVEVTAAGCARGWFEIEDTKAATIRLHPGAVISGKVTANGRPVPLATVHGDPTAPTFEPLDYVCTGPDGTYTLSHLLAGQRLVEVQPPPDFAAPDWRPVLLKTGQTASGIDFALTPGAVIRGQATDINTGRPVAGVRVSVKSETAQFRFATTETAKDGTYQLRVLPGRYSLYALEPDSGVSTPAKELGALAEGDVVKGQDFKVHPSHKVVVRVLLPDGQPAVNAECALSWRDCRDKVQHDGTIPVTFPWRARGTTGAVQSPFLYVRVPGKNLCGVLQAKGAPERPTLTLHTGDTAVVRVKDEQGKPVPGVKVWATTVVRVSNLTIEDGIKLISATSDEQGVARLTCLPAGLELRFRIAYVDMPLAVNYDWPQQKKYGPKPVYTLKPGQQLSLPDVVMKPAGRSLDVAVTDDRHRPVKGALVYFWPYQKPFITDKNGRVSLTKLSLRSETTIVAVHPTKPLCAVANVDPGKEQSLTLVLRSLGTISGRLVSKRDGKPLSGFVVDPGPRLSVPSLPYETLQRLWKGHAGGGRGKTDQNGRWQVDGLYPGVPYRLTFTREWWKEGPEIRCGDHYFTAAGGPAVQDLGTIEGEIVKK